MMSEKENELLREICERLSSIEAKMEVKMCKIDIIETKAYDGFNKAVQCENDICAIKDNQKWFKRSIITTLLSWIAVIATYFIKK